MSKNKTTYSKEKHEKLKKIMFKVDTILNRIITNFIFGSAILLTILLVVFLFYYIDKQSNLDMDQLNQMVEEEIKQNSLSE
jgi:hypothetical protein